MDGVVATFLLAIAIISIAGVIMFAVTQGSASSRATNATILAEQELEAVRDLQYDDLVNATRAVTLGTGAFVVRRTVTTTDLPSMMKRIHVEVTWGNGQRYDAETIFGYLGS
jgi:Tfp pilus assembly protein PilV